MPEFVRTSENRFAPGYFPLPTPAPLQFIQRLGASPLAPGLYEFGYSFVAPNGLVTDMGPTVQVQLEENSNYGVRFDNEVWTRTVAICLWTRKVGGTGHPMEFEWRPAGAQPDCNHAPSTPRPYLPMTGWTNHILEAQEIVRCVRMHAGQGWERYEDTPRSPEPAPSHAPAIIPYYMPPDSFDIRIRHVGYNGMASAPSTAVTVPAGTNHSPIQFYKPAEPLQGVAGYFIEARKNGTTAWFRQKNPAQTGLVWPFAMTHFELKHYDEDTPSTDDTSGQIYLCSLQRALSEQNKSVIVDSQQIAYSPIFNGIHAINRTIQGEQGLPFKIKANHPHAVWVEGSYGTVINGLHVESPDATVGIDFCSYNGSVGATRINNPVIKLTRADRHTTGIRQLIEARASDNHTASEVIITNPQIGATHPYVVEGGQSANWEIRNNSSTVYGEKLSSHSSVNTSGSFRFTGQTLMERGRSALAILSARSVIIENLFSDAGFPSFACVSNRTAPVIEISLAVPNQHTPWLHVLEAACMGKTPVELTITGRQDATDVDAMIFTTRYCGVRYKIAASIRFSSFSRSQPSMSWWNTMMADFVNAKSYFFTWDNNVDIVGQVPQDIVYGKTPITVAVTT